MNWMEGFISQCLEGVPEGAYRTRTEKELQDHLLALCQELEQSGYTQAEARALAISRMGSPAELARSCLREWKRRSLWRRRLMAAELVPVIPCMIAMGYLYIFNTRNFGKAWVAYWGIAAILTAGVLLWSLHGFFSRHWTAMKWCCLVLAAIQLPPIQCWMFYLYSAFEFFGVMVPGWAGFSIHALFFIWAAFNYNLITRFQREDNLLKRGQSA